MFIIYIFLIIFLFLIFSLLFAIKEDKTLKYLRNFNYKYIKNFNQVEIILLYDYIYKLIAMKNPLQLKKEYEEEGADFIKRIKKIIEYKLYLIKTNKENPKSEIIKLVQALEPDVNVIEPRTMKKEKRQ